MAGWTGWSENGLVQRVGELISITSFLTRRRKTDWKCVCVCVCVGGGGGGVKQMVELVSIRPISNMKKKTAWKWKGGVDGGLDGSERMDGLDEEK